MHSTVRGLSALVVLVWVMVSAGGCGSAATPIDGSVPVSGTVTFNGQPLEQGMVRFAPESGGKAQPATGQIKNGKFTMVTTASSPGVVVGKYKVSIISNKPFAPPPLKPGTPPDPKPNSSRRASSPRNTTTSKLPDSRPT